MQFNQMPREADNISPKKPGIVNGLFDYVSSLYKQIEAIAYLPKELATGTKFGEAIGLDKAVAQAEKSIN